MYFEKSKFNNVLEKLHILLKRTHKSMKFLEEDYLQYHTHTLTLRGSLARIDIGVFMFLGASDPVVHLYVLDNAGRTSVFAFPPVL